MFRDAWDMRLAQVSEVAGSIKAKLRQIEKQVEQLLDRIVEASNPSFIAAYETRLSKLEREKALAEEHMISAGKPRHTLEESFELALTFLSNPWKIWEKSNLMWKKTVLRLAFVEPIAYCWNQVFEPQIYPFHSRP